MYFARYSKRTGDSVSARCMSVNCTNDARPVRRVSRPALPAASSERTTSGQPGPAASRLYVPVPVAVAACSSVVPSTVTARRAEAAIARSRSAAEAYRPSARVSAAAAAAAEAPVRNWRLLCARMWGSP